MILAFDCDLRKAFAVNDHDHQPWQGFAPISCPQLEYHNLTTVLFEIASPLDYSNSKAIAHHKRRWTIWNVACAARLGMKLLQQRPGVVFLVSPSSAWTRGYDVKSRHALAKCKQKNKDLREAEAMIWFYQQRPQDWVSLPDFLLAL